MCLLAVTQRRVSAPSVTSPMDTYAGLDVGGVGDVTALVYGHIDEAGVVTVDGDVTYPRTPSVEKLAAWVDTSLRMRSVKSGVMCQWNSAALVQELRLRGMDHFEVISHTRARVEEQTRVVRALREAGKLLVAPGVGKTLDQILAAPDEAAALLRMVWAATRG